MVKKSRSEEPDVFTYSALISSCDKGGQWACALNFLSEMWKRSIQPNRVTYCAAISACEKGHRWHNVVRLLEEMRHRSLKPGSITYSAAVAAFEKGKQWAGCWPAMWAALEPFLQEKTKLPEAEGEAQPGGEFFLRYYHVVAPDCEWRGSPAYRFRLAPLMVVQTEQAIVCADYILKTTRTPTRYKPLALASHADHASVEEVTRELECERQSSFSESRGQQLHEQTEPLLVFMRTFAEQLDWLKVAGETKGQLLARELEGPSGHLLL